MPQIQIRRATSAQWASANPVLASGEMGLDQTLSLFKMGNGFSTWANLPFTNEAAASLINSATPSAEVVLRTNLVIDPHAVNAVNFGLNNGGGTLSTTVVNGKRRVIWGTNGTTTGGVNAALTLIPGNFVAGETYTMSILVKPSRSNNVQFGWYIKNAAGTNVGGGISTNTYIQAGVEQRLSATGLVAAAGTSMYFYLYHTTANSGTLPLAGDYLEFDEIISEKSATVGSFFDGDRLTSGDITYRWAGSPNASISYQMNNATLVRRSPSGTLEVGTPLSSSDAVTKGYVDSSIGSAVTGANATNKGYVDALVGQASSNVRTEGAKGDANDFGGTDDTGAFQLAMDKAAGTFGFGGTMLIPPGSYRLHGSVKLKSNVRIIGYGALIRKYSGNSTYSSFEAVSNGLTGYGSSVVNVLFEGMTFQGKFGTSSAGNCVTMHHAQSVTFRKVTWTEAMVTGHAVDMMGCDGIMFDDCSVKGFDMQAGREYVEAFQCDHSMNGAGGSDYTNVASFDGLPTINVTIQNSRFVPLKIGTTTYPAPNPLGTHSRVEGMWIENIKFDNNLVDSGIETSTITDGFSVLTRGWIHFFNARNIQITRNRFKAASGKASRIFSAYAISTGWYVSDAQTDSPPSHAIAIMPISNLKVMGNSIEGFASDTNESMFDIRGTQSAKASQIKFHFNTWKDCFSTPGTPGDKGQDPIYVQDCFNVELIGNDVRYARSLIYGYRSNKIKIIGGMLRDIGSWAGRFSECGGVSARDVDVENFGGAWWSYNNLLADSSASPQVATGGFFVTGGSLVQGYSSTQLAGLAAQPINLSGTSRFRIAGVDMPYNSNSGYTKVVSIYNSASNGRVEDNVAFGWVNQIQSGVALGVAGTSSVGANVVIQNNMV